MVVFQYPDILPELNRAMATEYAVIVLALAHVAIFSDRLPAGSLQELMPTQWSAVSLTIDSVN
ncbi:MAG: hypothetical protein P8J17_05120 [Halioglobus sp.]|nr:hypothetical protein [Halioglobus sp.]